MTVVWRAMSKGHVSAKQYILVPPVLTDISKEDASRRNFAGVYELLDAAERTLYIGQSANVPSRVEKHRKKKWGASITTVLWTYEPCPEQRLVSEALLILDRRPRHNRHISLGIRADGSVYEMGWMRGNHGAV
jgi:hypothetical protein